MGRRNRREKRREARRSLPLQSLHNSFLAPSVRNIYSRIYENKKLRRNLQAISVRPRNFFSNSIQPHSRQRGSKLENSRGLSLSGMRSVLESRPVFYPVRARSTCESRQTRKEIIHATGKAGRVGQRKPRFTLQSKISCKKG